MNELTASITATPATGSVSAAINLRTPEPALALAGVAVIGVAVIGLGAVMLTWGLPHHQTAELALTEDDGGRLGAAA